MTTNIRSKLTGHALLATLMWGKDGKVKNGSSDGRLDAPVRTKFTTQPPPRTLREGLFFEGE